MEPLHPGDAPPLGARSRSVRDRVEDELKAKGGDPCHVSCSRLLLSCEHFAGDRSSNP
jgi:hypothetical protein